MKFNFFQNAILSITLSTEINDPFSYMKNMLLSDIGFQFL